MPGACWQRPRGRAATPTARTSPGDARAFEDAEAFAAGGKSLPTEAEWERAARGGLDGAVFAWGDEMPPDEHLLANTWQGEFPWQNLMLDGHLGTSPVDAFPPNGFGLHDMCGYVWEWTSDSFSARHPDAAPSRCCAPRNPRVTSAQPGPFVAGEPGAHIGRRVIEGRLAPLRTELPPALPPRRPAERGGGHRPRVTSAFVASCAKTAPLKPLMPSPKSFAPITRSRTAMIAVLLWVIQ